MAARHSTDTYAHSFQTFLKHTNEKEIFLQILTKKLQDLSVHSMLDIGAGNGDLAIPLSKIVPRYTAIERNPAHAHTLRSAGIMTQTGVFPSGVTCGLYDFVLSSHSSPWRPSEYEPFIEAAWNTVTRGGSLLVITYDDEKGEWMDFRRTCGLPFANSVRGRLDGIHQKMSLLGEFSHEKVTTLVKTKTLEDMLGALAFVHSDGEPYKLQDFAQNTKVGAYLESHYKDAEGYTFPFTHWLLQVTKT